MDGLFRIDDILTSIPDVVSFPTLDRFGATIEQLVAAHPDAARIEPIGASTEGETIRMLRIGRGEEELLFIGCPHPNEPIGMLSIEALARFLLERGELRDNRFTWNFILCAEPDGVRLNEDWMGGPFSISRYVRSFYRPAFEDQAILAFPFAHRDYGYFRPIAETEALIHAITALRPRFVASLHNAAFGGGYFYLSPYIERLGDPLRRLLEERGIPLSLGTPEVSWTVEHSPAFFECATVRDEYEALAAQGERPAARIHTGETTYGFAKAICDPLFLISEVPYFADARMADTRPADVSVRESVLAGIERVRGILELLSEGLDAMSGQWTTDHRLRRAVERIVPDAVQSEAAKQRWAIDDRTLDRLATVAEDVAHRVQTPFYYVLNVGMFRRALRIEAEVTPTVRLAALQKTVDARLDAWLAEFEQETAARAVPIRHLVEVQVGAALLAIRTL